ncbi:MAG: hypothetical protein Q7Q73_10165 [Verrucomicrobiota bacterium JB024]|nr:hypothetical protein [Verrucomicrobiota bacterium JB024]
MHLLLDTNILSETMRPRPDAHVMAFLNRGLPSYLSALTLHELRYGTVLEKYGRQHPHGFGSCGAGARICHSTRCSFPGEYLRGEAPL